MQEIRRKARERIQSHCKVCPVCDGRACAGQVPGMGGIGTGASFKNNVAAFAQCRVAMRVLHTANDPDVSCTLWGRTLALPVLGAPIGSVKNNLGSDLDEDAYSDLVISGAVQAGTLCGIGDTAKPETFRQGLSVVRDRGRSVIPFIKPWSLDAVAQRMDMVLAAGCDICGMDVDAAGLTILRRLAAPVATRTPAELTAIIKAAHARQLKFIVKGIMTVDEARIAVDAGADAVLVSNHGGRVLDYTPGTAEVLPAIADAVGRHTLVMVDGGVRTGLDVLKAFALGARLALVCRPVAVAAHGGGAEGVARYFSVLQDELSQAMRLTGCATLQDIGPGVLC